jgi:hypothetical protein
MVVFSLLETEDEAEQLLLKILWFLSGPTIPSTAAFLLNRVASWLLLRFWLKHVKRVEAYRAVSAFVSLTTHSHTGAIINSQ